MTFELFLSLHRDFQSQTDVIPVDTEFKPVYLQALTLNNLPSEQWGPRRRANQTGIYAHLNKTIIQKRKSIDRRTHASTHSLKKHHDEPVVNNDAYEPDRSDESDDENKSSRY